MPFGFGVNCEPSAVACLEKDMEFKMGLLLSGECRQSCGVLCLLYHCQKEMG